MLKFIPSLLPCVILASCAADLPNGAEKSKPSVSQSTTLPADMRAMLAVRSTSGVIRYVRVSPPWVSSIPGTYDIVVEVYSVRGEIVRAQLVSWGMSCASWEPLLHDVRVQESTGFDYVVFQIGEGNVLYKLTDDVLKATFDGVEAPYAYETRTTLSVDGRRFDFSDGTVIGPDRIRTVCPATKPAPDTAVGAPLHGD